MDASMGELEILGMRSSISPDADSGCSELPDEFDSNDEDVSCGLRGARRDIERAWLRIEENGVLQRALVVA
jgi:hypothetical protein